jgi:ABC-2 type transport system ATP-binding protein
MTTAEKNSSVIVEGLSRRFGEFPAVDTVSFSVRKGEVFGFLGPNGAGKSTTIRMLCGLLTPSSGSAVVEGIDVGKDPDKVKSLIGYMSQRFSLYEDLTVQQNIDFYGGIYGLEKKRLKERSQWVVRMAGLEGKEDELTSSLSGGWKQRLALGCAILHEPPILFLDEPTGGVDPVSRRTFWDLIYRLSAAGTTVFVTTHYMDEAEHCHSIGFIYAGKLVATGTPGELKHLLTETQTFEIQCDHPLDAIDQLQDAEWVQETSIFGATLHVSTAVGVATEDRIRDVLESKGNPVTRLQIISPSLEDVFIHLISREDAARGQEAAA